MVRKLNMVALLSVIIFFFCLETVFGFKALDGNIEINGYYKNDSAIRLSDGQSDLHGEDTYGLAGTAEGWEAGDYYLCRNTLQIEVAWDLQKNLNMYGIWRGYYDASLDINRDFKQNMIDADSERAIDDYEKDTELRELYVNIFPGNWNFRIGKQQIVWGESDGFRMADIINPLDYSWHYFFPSWEDIRIPLWGADIIYAIPSEHQVSVELVCLPGAFNTGFQPNKLAPSGANWSSGFLNQYFHDALDAGTSLWTDLGMLPSGMHLKDLLPGLVGAHGRTGAIQYFQDSMEKSVPENSIRNCELGMRLNAMLGNWDVSIFDFYSRNDNPTFRKDWLTRLQSSTSSRDELFEYVWLNKLGATFNVYNNATKAVFRGECVYTLDEPFFPKNPFTIDLSTGLFDCTTYESDTFSYMLGFDRPTTIPLLNRYRTFFISGQIFQKYILDYDNNMTTMDMSNDDIQTLFTLLVNTGYKQDTILPQVFMMYDASGEGWIQPQVEYVYGDFWRFGIGANILMSNDKKQAYFGGMRDNDDVYAWAKFAW